ncbi:hypothetical protein CUS95_00715 [Enterococcus faecium]|nr:hypothetical protein CUS95_00715 [Enterococcus faecium]PQF18370.1 hypothetical protein CUS93_14570 [Enterococcus faecium]PQG65228.1 hypothetical protein CUS28_04880 [Enterococcus faecium]
MQKCGKPFSQNFSSYSKLSCFFTTSSLNGVQKLASAGISPAKRKIGGAIFVRLFLLLDADQLFHNLLKLHIFP